MTLAYIQMVAIASDWLKNRKSLKIFFFRTTGRMKPNFVQYTCCGPLPKLCPFTLSIIRDGRNGWLCNFWFISIKFRTSDVTIILKWHVQCRSIKYFQVCCWGIWLLCYRVVLLNCVLNDVCLGFRALS